MCQVPAAYRNFKGSLYVLHDWLLGGHGHLWPWKLLPAHSSHFGAFHLDFSPISLDKFGFQWDCLFYIHVLERKVKTCNTNTMLKCWSNHIIPKCNSNPPSMHLCGGYFVRRMTPLSCFSGTRESIHVTWSSPITAILHGSSISSGVNVILKRF